MKKFFFCIILLAITQNIFSQNSGRKWTVQFSPFLMFSDIFIENAGDSLIIMDLEGQYKINNSSNISLTLSFLYNDRTYRSYDIDSPIENIYKENYYQVGFKPMYIHRPFETGLRGFYLGIYPNLGFRFSKVDENNKFFTELGFGFTLGYKWIFRSGLTMQLGTGIGKTFSIPAKTMIHDGFINSDGRITRLHTDITICDFKIGYSF